jgi:hypothetical protein
MLGRVLRDLIHISNHMEETMKSLFPKLFCLLVILLLATPAAAPGQAAAEPLVVRSVGLLDTDGTVLYSVILASGPQALGKLIVTGSVPDGAELVEVLNAPPETIAQAQKDGVSWQVKALDADTILGPFTYRVRLKDKTANPPLTAGAMVSWTDPELGTVEAKESKGKLEPLADSGSITIDSRGTLNDKGENDAVPVGKTGIVIFVPAGAVSQPTTLTFNRLVIDEKDNKSVPADQPDVWWCALVSISTSPATTLAKPITLALPTRRTVTPGMRAQLFVRGKDGEWQQVASAHDALPTFTDNLVQDKFPATQVFGAPSGNHVVISQFVINSPQIVAPGLALEDFTKVEVNDSNLPTTQITDGTSNTAVGFVKQDNIIAILVGRR